MVDAQVGKIVASLQNAGMADNTLVLFSSDNGPVWYDADVQRFGHDSVGGLRGMKADAWEGGHRMPFIVRWPGVVAEGSTCDHLVSFVDVLATLAEISGQQLTDEAGPDSFSFLPLLKGATKPTRTELPVQAGGGMMSLRIGEWKYINALGSGGFSQPKKVKPKPGQPNGQLYDLSKDRNESKNRIAEESNRAKAMQERLKEIKNSDGHRILGWNPAPQVGALA